MNCTEFERRLHAVLDERGSLASPLALGNAFAEHTQTCQVCAALWQSQASLHRIIDVWAAQLPGSTLTANGSADVGLSESFANRVLADLRETRPVFSNMPAPVQAVPVIRRHPVSRRILITTLGGWAAALFWAISIVPFSDTHQPDPGGTGLVTSRLASDQERAGELENLVASAHGAYSRLATETLGAMQEATLFVPPTGLGQMLHFPESTPETAPTSLWSGLETGLQSDLAPLRANVGEALGFLRGVMPSSPPS